MGAHDDPQTDPDDGEVTGFGLVGGLLGDGSVLPNPTQLPTGVSHDITVSKRTDVSSSEVFRRAVSTTTDG